MSKDGVYHVCAELTHLEKRKTFIHDFITQQPPILWDDSMSDYRRRFVDALCDHVEIKPPMRKNFIIHILSITRLSDAYD